MEVKTVHLSTPSSVSDRESDDGNVQSILLIFCWIYDFDGEIKYQSVIFCTDDVVDAYSFKYLFDSFGVYEI